MDALPASLPNPGLPQPVSAANAGLAILLAELSESLAQAIAKLPPNTPLTALVTQVLPQTPAAAPTPSAPGSAKPAIPGTLVQISTPDGSAQIRLPPQIPVAPGAKLEIQIAPPNPNPNPTSAPAPGAPPQPQQWRLLTVDDRPATPAGLAPAPVTSPAPSATAAPAVAATVSLPVKPPAQGIPATLVTSTNPALPSGTTLVVRISGLTPPPQPGAAAASPPAQTPASAPTVEEEPPEPVQTAAPTPTPGKAPSQAPSIDSSPPPAAPEEAPSALGSPPQVSPPAATQAPVILQTIPAPATVPMAPLPATPPNLVAAPSPPAPISAPPPQQIDGQVLPNTDAGKPLIRTPIGLLSLDTGPQSLPPDSTVTLQVVGKPVPPPAFTPLVPLAEDQLEQILPKHLSRMMQAVEDSPDDAAPIADQVREKIPTPGPKLAAQLLSAVSTAAQPDGLARFFGGELTTSLAHAAPQALEALSRHWETAAAPVQGPGEGDWRALMIPFMMGGEVTNLRLTVRQRQGKMAAAEREKGTRFLLDLDLSRLGPMQLDGLVKRQHKRFDLIIRSHAPLSGEMRRDIDALFIAGLLNFGLEGSVVFKPDGRFVATPRLTATANGTIFA